MAQDPNGPDVNAPATTTAAATPATDVGGGNKGWFGKLLKGAGTFISNMFGGKKDGETGKTTFNIGNIAKSLLGLGKKPESKDGETGGFNVGKALGGALSGWLPALLKGKPGSLTGIIGSLLGGALGGTNKSGNKGVLGGLFNSPILTLLVSLLVNNTKKGSVSTVDQARNVLANARNNSTTVGNPNSVNARLDRMERIMANGGPPPAWNRFNAGYPPAPPVRFAAPPPRFAAMQRPRPMHNHRPTFRTPGINPGHAVNRIMPNNFGPRMV